MRVLCITTHSDRPEAETFIALHQQGVEITVMCTRTAPYFEHLQNQGVEVIPLDLKSRIDLAAVAAIRKLLKQRHYEILHMFNNRAVSNGLLAAVAIDVKCIAYRGIVGNVSYFDPASWMTYLNPKVNRIVCVADAIREYFHRMSLLGLPFPVRKAITLYKGHDLSWYRETPLPLDEFGIGPDDFTVGCIANNRPRKGINYLIEAMEYLEQEDIHLLLIGHVQSTELLNQIDVSRANARIHLSGFRPDAPRIIASCQTAVLPAIKREGLPKAIIEAMVYRVPPIVTDSGGSPELIVNGESGLVVPVMDSKAIAAAIRKLHDDKTLRVSMGQAAQQRIDECFNHRDTVSNTLNLYHELLSGH